MEIDLFTDIFFQMETEESFFSIRTPRNEPAWDIVRYNNFLSLCSKIDSPNSSQSLPLSDTFRSWRTKLQSSPQKLFSIARHWGRLKRLPPTDFVAYVCSRYRDAKDNPVDFATEDSFQALKGMGSVTKIESQPGLLQDLNVGPLFSVVAKIHRPPAGYRRWLHDFVEVIAGAQKKYFGVVDPDLLQVTHVAYRYYAVQRHVWQQVLDSAQPSLILMIQNGIQKGAITAARERKIPVMECQHGVINLMHPAYAYSQDLPREDCVILPDVFLLFSEYWRHQCRLPGTRLAVIGNDWFSSAGVRSSRKGAAVFVDAGIFHRYLSPVAIEIAKLMPERSFVVKLHPLDLSNRTQIEREYEGIPNLFVVGAEKTFPELLADASDVVAVQSTATYEALDRGVPVHFLQKGDYRSHQDLFTQPDVHLFSSAEELKGTLFKPNNDPGLASKFFQGFDQDAFHDVVRAIL